MQNYNRPMLYRLYTIHNMIADGGYPNCTDFKRRLEVSLPTINRDIDALRYDFNAPIEYSREKNGYFYTELFELPFKDISDCDADTLLCAKSLLSNFENTPFYNDYLQTITNLISPSFDPSDNNSNIFNRVEIAKRPEYKKADKKVWADVVAAIRENKFLEFSYKSRNFPKMKENPDLRRVAAIYQIVFDGGNSYIFAKEKDSEQEKLYALHRMGDTKVSDETFDEKDIISFNKWNNNSRFGAFSSDLGNLHYKIKFVGGYTREIKETTYGENQKVYEEYKDGRYTGTILEFDSTAFQRIQEWVFQQGSSATPIEPWQLVCSYRIYWWNMINSIYKKLRKMRKNPDDNKEEEKLNEYISKPDWKRDLRQFNIDYNNTKNQ